MLAIWYWILLLLWLVLGLFSDWPADRSPRAFLPVGSSLLHFLLFVILGIKVFGSPLQ